MNLQTLFILFSAIAIAAWCVRLHIPVFGDYFLSHARACILRDKMREMQNWFGGNSQKRDELRREYRGEVLSRLESYKQSINSFDEAFAHQASESELDSLASNVYRLRRQALHDRLFFPASTLMPHFFVQEAKAALAHLGEYPEGFRAPWCRRLRAQSTALLGELETHLADIDATTRLFEPDQTALSPELAVRVTEMENAERRADAERKSRFSFGRRSYGQPRLCPW